MLLRKNVSFLEEENSLTEELFFQTSGNSIRGRKVYKMNVLIQNLAIKGYQATMNLI